MIELNSDANRRRLDLTVRPPLAEDDLAGLPERIRQEAAVLGPGYVVAVDLRRNRPLPPAQVDYIRQAQEVMVATGARKIATLVDPNPPAAHQLVEMAQLAHSQTLTQRFTDEGPFERFLEA